MDSFSVVNNLGSVNAQSKLFETNIGLRGTLGRLSSSPSLRINQSGDEAAGLGIANKFRSELVILQVGVRNANDGLSKLQIADHALNNISKLLDRAATLATQAASGGLITADGRTVLNSEFQQLLAEIDREAGIAGLDTATSFTVYISNDTNSSGSGVGTVSVNFGTVTAIPLGLTASSTTLTTEAVAQAALTSISGAITTLGSLQGSVGSAQNRLSLAINPAQTQIVNKTAAESRILDVNNATGSANLTRFNILTHTGLASLAQANQISSYVLSLLR